jgi:hypothetical protein
VWSHLYASGFFGIPYTVTTTTEVEVALTADYKHRQTGSGIGLPAGFIVVAARRP